MLRTDIVIKFLKKEKAKTSFDKIWAGVKEETLKTMPEGTDENQAKADLYMSMMEDPDIIMIEGNNWDLKSNFSFEEVNEIVKTRMTEELELDISSPEKSDDTIEMELGIIDGQEEE